MVKPGSYGLSNGTLSFEDGLDLIWCHFCKEYLKISLFGREYLKISLLGENLSSFLDFGREYLKVYILGENLSHCLSFRREFLKESPLWERIPFF